MMTITWLYFIFFYLALSIWRCYFGWSFAFSFRWLSIANRLFCFFLRINYDFFIDQNRRPRQPINTQHKIQRKKKRRNKIMNKFTKPPKNGASWMQTLLSSLQMLKVVGLDFFSLRPLFWKQLDLVCFVLFGNNRHVVFFLFVCFFLFGFNDDKLVSSFWCFCLFCDSSRLTKNVFFLLFSIFTKKYLETLNFERLHSEKWPTTIRKRSIYLFALN